MIKITTVENSYPVINSLIAEMQPIFDAERKFQDRLETINLIETSLSPLHAFIRLFSDFQTQVTQNGLSGYFTNGTHSSIQAGCMDDISKDDDLFQKLIELTEKHKFLFDDPDSISSLLTLLNAIDIQIDLESEEEVTCSECFGNCTIEQDDEEVDCPSCDGTGWETESNQNKGQLTASCKEKLSNIENDFLKLDDKIFISIANRILMNKESINA